MYITIQCVLLTLPSEPSPLPSDELHNILAHAPRVNKSNVNVNKADWMRIETNSSVKRPLMTRTQNKSQKDTAYLLCYSILKRERRGNTQGMHAGNIGVGNIRATNMLQAICIHAGHRKSNTL